jgi:osmotically-inducible protein OsmY
MRKRSLLIQVLAVASLALSGGAFPTTGSAGEDQEEGFVRLVDLRMTIPVDPLRDRKIAEAIRLGLLNDPLIEEHRIAITVSNGRAYLMGTVHSPVERSRVEQVASRVAGATRIVNDLALAPAPPLRMDLRIGEAIERDFAFSPVLDPDRIKVHVDDGVVLLTGSVDSPEERRAATDYAYQEGAKLVVNKLRVVAVD